jgi:osmotically-inducible protein OsmY
MKKDNEIQKNVLEELDHLPFINTAQIGVTVRNGIVNLSGRIDTYPHKIIAERAILKLKNVHGVADNLEVILKDENKKSDPEIAQAVLYAIEWHSGLDPDNIKIIVENGIVTMAGEVNWDYQRKLAYQTVSHINGVIRVINNIKLAERPISEQVKEKIRAAFQRNANIEAGSIHVSLEGNTVILNGKVRSWLEKLEVENTIWSLPGIVAVENKLEYSEPSYSSSYIIES